MTEIDALCLLCLYLSHLPADIGRGNQLKKPEIISRIIKKTELKEWLFEDEA